MLGMTAVILRAVLIPLPCLLLMVITALGSTVTTLNGQAPVGLV